MTEPPGARLRVGLSALTVAEYGDAEGKDAAFIDNIFRFTQVGWCSHAAGRRRPIAAG
jgi:F-type H+-transporting ATPase subunit beta